MVLLMPTTFAEYDNSPCTKFKMLSERTNLSFIATGPIKTLEKVYEGKTYLNRGSCYTSITGIKAVTHLYSTEGMRQRSKDDLNYLLGEKKEVKTASMILELLLEKGLVSQEILNNL